MKKLILVLLMIAISFTPKLTSNADAEVFARIENEGVFFYYEKPDGITPLFELPVSYFVKIQPGKNGYYSAQYQDLEGFVKTGEVTPVTNKPQSPYFYSKIQVLDFEELDIYPTPAHKQSIGKISIGDQTTNYYGAIFSNDGIDGLDKKWYYVENSSQKGYVYFHFCKLLTPFEENTEISTAVKGDIFTSSQSGGLSDVAKTFIILGISLPCALILYLLIKPTLSSSPSKEKVHRRKGKDYFEFDENDLN